jgi:hypothetical protein
MAKFEVPLINDFKQFNFAKSQLSNKKRRFNISALKKLKAEINKCDILPSSE